MVYKDLGFQGSLLLLQGADSQRWLICVSCHVGEVIL